MVWFAERVARTALQVGGYTSRQMSTSAGKIHLLEAEGRGRLSTVVLIHGLGSTGVHFLPLLPFLSPHVRRIVLPDLPGHGFSDPLPRGAGLIPMAHGLVEALDQVLDEPAVFLGNSLGGGVAVRYARSRPEQVRGLVLVSPAGGSCDRKDLDRILHQFHFTSHADAVAFVDRLLANPGPVRHIVAEGLRRRFAAPTLKEMVDALSPADLLTAEHVQQLTVPTVLIWGRNDRILPASQLEFFRANLPPQTRIEEPAGVGHSPYLEQPALLAESVLRFMRELQPLAERRSGTAAA